MFTRRSLLLSASGALAACATVPERLRAPFVHREGTAFTIDGRPYHYAGSNMWYAAYLGADAPFGNRARLRRELDALAAMGVDNVRILGGSELSPLKNSITPGFRTQGATYNETLLAGLDYALAEMGRRGMRAVIYLTNFWEWSGGMMTYLHWVNGGRYINMNDPAHPWPEFPDFVSQFYSDERAIALYHNYVRSLVARRNTVSGLRYVDDPAIMSWQLANEPRPAGSEKVGERSRAAFLAWVRSTARLIKSLDPHHLVSTGSEGLKGALESADLVLDEHRGEEIDYLTAHIWPLNWGWVDAKDLPGTFEAGADKVREYIAQHIGFARTLGKPLVIEEFGFPRDLERYDPGTPTSFRDQFYRLIYGAVLDSARSGGPLVGSNFWAWNGEGRTANPDHRFRPGDTAYFGDPPHEPQGWYGVFDTDLSTRALIGDHAAALQRTRPA